MQYTQSYNDHIVQRVRQVASIMIQSPEVTIRGIAKDLGVSKSTVHKDLVERLPQIDVNSSNQIRSILENHWETKHIKGGEATKLKYNNIAI